MRKDRTKNLPRKPQSPSRRPAPTSGSGIGEGGVEGRRSLYELVLSRGFEGLIEELEADRERLCGPARRWREDRQAYRHGYDEGPLVFGGRKVIVRKPRVRSVDGGELVLPSWREFRNEDPLSRRAIEQILVGVTTRNYARSLEDLPERLGSHCTSRSEVSRRFVARTARQVEGFLSRRLEDLDLPVIMLDGTGVGEHLLLVALGIDRTGRKHVLGVVEGSTENEAVCRRLLRDLIDRGLSVERARLFVIDGGRGIRKAIREVFGEWALVQRCQVHKLRNIMEHLPEGKRSWVRAAVRRAWGSASASEARRKLKGLASQIEEVHPGAAASIREGLEETVTVLALGLEGWLLKTLCSTNPIENLQGTLKRIARNVKRWRGGRMALRWGVTGVMDAEKKFRRIKGHRAMPQLLAALDAQVGVKQLDTQERVA